MFLLTITVILAIFALDITLSILNYRNRRAEIPANVSDIYDNKEYNKWLNYTMEGFRLDIIMKVFNTLILLAFLLFGVFNKLAELTSAFHHSEVIQVLAFLAVYEVVSYVLRIGFTLYRTFSIEERYGFNKTTPKTFILDQIKSMVIYAFMAGGLMYFILSNYLRIGPKSLFYVYLVIMAIVLLINILYTRVFIKIFNKITPIEDGELKDKVTTLASDLGYEIKTISVMDASKRSTRLNAFFSGFGKFKSIILFDNLIEKCTPDEVVSVLAHEIGHSINKDVLKGIFLTALRLSLYMVILAFFFTSSAFATAFGFETIHLGFAIILFGIMLEPINVLISIPLSKMSRRDEYNADKVAAKAGYRDALISALKVLARENYANLTPHPLVVKMTYSHPPIHDRIKSLEEI